MFNREKVTGLVLQEWRTDLDVHSSCCSITNIKISLNLKHI